MSLSADDLHALRGLVRAHRKRKLKKLANFAPRPGQGHHEAEAGRQKIVEAARFYVGLEQRVRGAEQAARRAP